MTENRLSYAEAVTVQKVVDLAERHLAIAKTSDQLRWLTDIIQCIVDADGLPSAVNAE